MARIVLSDYECRNGMLPDVCMFCGEPATRDVKKKFAWHPSWIWILILLSWLIALILALILTKRMTVRVPTCTEHEGFWRRKTWIVLGSFLGLLAFGVIAGVVADQLFGRNNDLFAWICAGSFVLLFAWLIVAGVMSTRGVRPKEITDREITLIGVADGFVEALREERRRDRAGELDNRDRRPVRSQEEEDFDDHPDDRY